MGQKVHSEVPLSFHPLLTHPLCPDSKTLFQSRVGRVSSVDSNICPPKLSCEIHKPPQLWGHTFACSTRSEFLPLRQGPIGAQDNPRGAGAHGTRPSGGPASLGLLWRQGRVFFFQSLVELHMVEIKGVAGCMVLLYFQALLLIRKQDQRQY